jgi:hypothetical protein
LNWNAKAKYAGFLTILGIFLKAKFDKTLNTKVALNYMINIPK